jgi:hypothetical protein
MSRNSASRIRRFTAARTTKAAGRNASADAMRAALRMVRKRPALGWRSAHRCRSRGDGERHSRPDPLPSPARLSPRASHPSPGRGGPAPQDAFPGRAGPRGPVRAARAAGMGPVPVKRAGPAAGPGRTDPALGAAGGGCTAGLSGPGLVSCTAPRVGCGPPHCRAGQATPLGPGRCVTRPGRAGSSS